MSVIYCILVEFLVGHITGHIIRQTTSNHYSANKIHNLHMLYYMYMPVTVRRKIV